MPLSTVRLPPSQWGEGAPSSSLGGFSAACRRTRSRVTGLRRSRSSTSGVNHRSSTPSRLKPVGVAAPPAHEHLHRDAETVDAGGRLHGVRLQVLQTQVGDLFRQLPQQRALKAQIVVCAAAAEQGERPWLPVLWVFASVWWAVAQSVRGAEVHRYSCRVGRLLVVRRR